MTKKACYLCQALYVIAENNSWSLVTIPKELVMTVTCSSDLLKHHFLREAFSDPSGQVRFPPQLNTQPSICFHHPCELHGSSMFALSSMSFRSLVDIVLSLRTLQSKKEQAACILSHLLLWGLTWGQWGLQSSKDTWCSILAGINNCKCLYCLPHVGKEQLCSQFLKWPSEIALLLHLFHT